MLKEDEIVIEIAKNLLVSKTCRNCFFNASPVTCGHPELYSDFTKSKKISVKNTCILWEASPWLKMQEWRRSIFEYNRLKGDNMTKQDIENSCKKW